MTTAKGEKELNITEDDWHLLLWSLHTGPVCEGVCHDSTGESPCTVPRPPTPDTQTQRQTTGLWPHAVCTGACKKKTEKINSCGKIANWQREAMRHFVDSYKIFPISFSCHWNWYDMHCQCWYITVHLPLCCLWHFRTSFRWYWTAFWHPAAACKRNWCRLTEASPAVFGSCLPGYKLYQCHSYEAQASLWWVLSFPVSPPLHQLTQEHQEEEEEEVS